MENKQVNDVEIEEGQERQPDADYYTHRFKRPILYNGQEWNALHFDFTGLTGRDSLLVENELAILNIPVIVPTLSSEYLIRIAVRACTDRIGADRIGADIFGQMPLRDYSRIRSAVRSFLLQAE